jgi:hypothetical protein
MKQFTTPEQTAKLIELGFEKPKGLTDAEPSSGKWVRPAYSIGELIEMLPPRIGRWELDIFHDYAFERWVICFSPEYHVGVAHELADALYNLIVKLKDEGNI